MKQSSIFGQRRFDSLPRLDGLSKMDNTMEYNSGAHSTKRGSDHMSALNQLTTSNSPKYNVISGGQVLHGQGSQRSTDKPIMFGQQYDSTMDNGQSSPIIKGQLLPEIEGTQSNTAIQMDSTQNFPRSKIQRTMFFN